VKDFLLGIVLSLLVVSITVVFLPNVPAEAHDNCTHSAYSILGKDLGRENDTKGNAGTMLVNDVQNVPHQTTRAVLVANDLASNFVEVGWRLGPDNLPSSENDPESFIAWEINNAYSLSQGVDVTRGSNQRYRAQDSNSNTLWTFYRNDVNFGPTVDHNFTIGSSFTLSETNATCDTAYAEFSNLRDCTGACTFVQYADLRCRSDNNPVYFFDKISDGQHKVRSPQSSDGC